MLSSFQSVTLAYALDRRTEETLEGMRSLARVLGGIPGRKEVIWLTAAFPFDLIPEDRNISEAEEALLQQGIRQTSLATQAGASTAAGERTSHTEEIRQAAAQLSAAQIALYPIDVRGLMSGMELNFNNTGVPVNSGVARMSDVKADQLTMRQLAEETGGKAYVNQNDIKSGIQTAVADSNASYTIGYYPEDKRWNGKYRTIKVKTNREGVQVRSRKGYFALDPVQIKKRKSEDDVTEALRDAIPTTLVTFSARVKRAEQGKIGIDFLVDAHSLTAADGSKGKKKLDADFYSLIVSPTGKILGTHSMKVSQEFPEDVYQQILQKGLLLHMDLDSQPGKDSQVRLAVRDNVTGYLGTIAGPLATQ